MKIPKAIQEFADENSLYVIPMTYKAQGIRLKRKGFDLIKSDARGIILDPNDPKAPPKRSHEIVVSIEPYQLGIYRWIFRHTHENYTGKTHFKKISKGMFKNINPKAVSYYSIVYI